MRRELPETYTEAWFRLHRHLAGTGHLWPTAIRNKIDADRWNSAFIRDGDVWYKPELKEL